MFGVCFATLNFVYYALHPIATLQRCLSTASQPSTLKAVIEDELDEEGEAHESASEYITLGPEGNLYSIVDQNFGVGLARYAR